jgi:hypothetical protein
MADRVKGEFGQTLEIALPSDFDLTGYVAVRICVEKPSKLVVTWTPTSIDEIYRLVRFVFRRSPLDLSESGVYKIWIDVDYGSPTVTRTEKVEGYFLDVTNSPC